MNLNDLGRLVTKYGAPLLGALICGPAGEAIGQMVANAFGGDIKEPAALMKIMSNDPQAAIKLSEIESNAKVELQRLLTTGENEKIRLANENTEYAREYSQKNHSIFPQILSLLIVFGFFVGIYWIAAYKQEKTDHEVLYLLFGILGTSFGAVVNFWLGSSADKTFNLRKP